MHTTIVTWPEDPSVLSPNRPEAGQLAARAKVKNFLDDVVANHGSTYQNFVSFVPQPNGSVIVTRNWPDQATAEAWLELVQSVNGTGAYSFT
jgi:hypothetical protein